MATLEVSLKHRAPARLTRSYFAATSLLLLAFTLIGFSDNLFTDVGQPSNFDPKFIVHGLFCLAWILLLVAQTLLVRAGNLRLHRRLGMAGVLIAIGVTLSTLYVFWAVWRGWGAMSFEVKANRLLLPGYAALVALACLNRARPDQHKRFIMVATFFMLGPVLSRAFDPILAPLVPFLPTMPESEVDRIFWLYFFIVWHGFFLSLLLYDWLLMRRLHRVSAGGYGLFCAIWAVAVLT